MIMLLFPHENGHCNAVLLKHIIPESYTQVLAIKRKHCINN
jgi:hypothetical protein